MRVLLPALHAPVATYGYVDARAIPLVADVFNLSRADITAVVALGKHFSRRPPIDFKRLDLIP
ncbi:MAG: hypothetical protein ACLFU0_07605 [Alphaproteobacteria bacterium]